MTPAAILGQLESFNDGSITVSGFVFYLKRIEKRWLHSLSPQASLPKSFKLMLQSFMLTVNLDVLFIGLLFCFLFVWPFHLVADRCLLRYSFWISLYASGMFWWKEIYSSQKFGKLLLDLIVCIVRYKVHWAIGIFFLSCRWNHHWSPKLNRIAIGSLCLPALDSGGRKKLGFYSV